MNTTSPRSTAIAAAFAIGSLFLLTACGGGGSREAGSSPPPQRLSAVVLQPEPAAFGVTATGTVLAEQQIDVQVEIAGRVTRINFREGSAVAAGQLLVELDGAELKAQADRAEANRMLAESRANRLRRDYEARAISQHEFEQSQAQWKSAEAEAALALAQWEKTRIRAPFGGIAGLREIELGSVVQPGTRVTTLQNMDSLRVEFSVPEREVGALRAGMTVRYLATGARDTLDAKVFAVESRIDPSTRMLRVRARGANPAGAGGRGDVLPGAFARVIIPMRADSALWIPTEAVVQGARGSQVWVAREGRARLVPFTPGLRSPSSVEAAEGLSPGDTVFTSGLMQLRDGAPALPVVDRD